MGGRNFQVFSLSADQLQSEATKAQIKSLLNLEPESLSPINNKYSTQDFLQQSDHHQQSDLAYREPDNIQKSRNHNSSNHDNYKEYSNTNSSPLKMSQTIENTDSAKANDNKPQ